MPRRKTVFVSCGQRTEDEKALGLAITRRIEAHNMEAFFAEKVHSANDLNSEVFKAIQTCDAFLAVLQKRGVVRFEKYKPVQRSSPWIQQEIATFCYRMFLEQRSLPIRVYSEREIRREGVMEIAVVNPIEFGASDELLADVDQWLGGHEFTEHAVLARREELFRHRFGEMTGDQILLLELIAAHCTVPTDPVDLEIVRNDFRVLLQPTGAKEIEAKFGQALTDLGNRSLIITERSAATGVTSIWIRKEWWQLMLDELRGRGRRV